MTPLVICGAGGFGREVVQIVAAINAVSPTWEVVGIVDDSPTDLSREHLARLGVPLLGPVDQLGRFAVGGSAVVAIGHPATRSRVVASHPTTDWATLVHPDATVGPDVTLGAGTVIAAGARLSTNITVGTHAQVDHNVTVGHDTTIGTCVRLNPQACISGSVTIGDETLVGANATVLQSLSLGAGVLVGAGAVVTRDVEPGRTVKGVPAR